MTCTTVNNYISGTKTGVAQNTPLVQYFKMYLNDASCYNDALTEWTLTNNPANGCTQTLISAVDGSRQVTVQTDCTTAVTVTTPITLNVDVYTTHLCGFLENTNCPGLLTTECCDASKYHA